MSQEQQPQPEILDSFIEQAKADGKTTASSLFKKMSSEQGFKSSDPNFLENLRIVALAFKDSFQSEAEAQMTLYRGIKQTNNDLASGSESIRSSIVQPREEDKL